MHVLPHCSRGNTPLEPQARRILHCHSRLPSHRFRVAPSPTWALARAQKPCGALQQQTRASWRLPVAAPAAAGRHQCCRSGTWRAAAATAAAAAAQVLSEEEWRAGGRAGGAWLFCNLPAQLYCRTPLPRCRRCLCHTHLLCTLHTPSCQASCYRGNSAADCAPPAACHSRRAGGGAGAVHLAHRRAQQQPAAQQRAARRRQRRRPRSAGHAS